MIYDIDYKRLALMLTPIKLRRGLLMNLMYVVMGSIERLSTIFLGMRKETTYRIRHNGQTCKLRSMLNDMFDPEQRRIEIENTERSLATIIWKRGIREDQVIAPRIITARSESIDESIRFQVILPIEMQGVIDEDRVRAIVNMYKLVSIRYEIKYVSI